jgi:hypothetical protein
VHIPAVFLVDHKPAINTVNPVPNQHRHHQNLTNLPTPHFEKHLLAQGRKSTDSKCVLFKLSKTMGSVPLKVTIRSGYKSTRDSVVKIRFKIQTYSTLRGSNALQVTDA